MTLLFIVFSTFFLTTSTVYAITEVTASITAQNTWTSSFAPDPGIGFINISIEGTGWSATVTLQKSRDGGSTWHDVATWTAIIQTTLTDLQRDVLYRIGVDTGDFTSGTIPVALGK